MNLYEYIPKKSNKKAIGVAIILLALAVGVFIYTLIFPDMPYRWGPQLIAIMSFVGFVFIMSRYVFKKFIYAIAKNDEGELDLTITEVTNAGKKKITVCRVSISNIEESHLLDCTVAENQQKLSDIKKNAKSSGRKIFDYCPDINPSEVCALVGEECGDKYLVIFCPDDGIWSYLKKES